MERGAPFEARPHLAVAVSGGPDSMALALLADRWARARGGAVTALTVDHGLRPGSRAEAQQVGAWLAARGIAHRTLRWVGDKPPKDAAVQEAARRARYRLLADWCRTHKVLHLLLAHHAGDQAETVLLRLARHSGPDGLAGMSSVVHTRWGRLVRPLLGLDGASLRATLAEAGQSWVEDPSNRDTAHLRVRMRGLAPTLAGLGVANADLVRLAHALGHARSRIEAATAALLARTVTIHPAGFARLDPAPLLAAPHEIGRRALAGLVRCLGGAAYPPRGAALDRLYARLDGPMKAATLGGCILVCKRDHVLVRRESAGQTPLELTPGLRAVWDGRFRVEVARGGGFAGPLTLAPLGRDGWAALATLSPEIRRCGVPGEVGQSLPAVWQHGTPVLVPHVNHDDGAPERPWARRIRLVFSPDQSLGPDLFSVV